ncbi:MAG: hypothetical protein SNJ72_05295 [Fimbriimonadales bacterium]
MAKPIPPNKRWLTEGNESTSSKTPGRVRLDPLIGVLELMVESPRRIEGGRLLRPRVARRHQPAQRRLGPTIIARYQGVCHACGQRIQQGESITLHPELRWVHTTCAYQAEQGDD